MAFTPEQKKALELNRAQAIYKDMAPQCNCGGPEDGTDHSPDCYVNDAWDLAVSLAEQDVYELECAIEEGRDIVVLHEYAPVGGCHAKVLC